MNYRTLTSAEIEQLKAQYCGSDNWHNIEVSADFKPATLWHVYFSGKIKLASFAKVFEQADGTKKHAGLYHVHLHNCSIGKDVYVAHVKRIANYVLEDNVFIEHVDLLSVESVSSFGNGTKVAVLDETGSREVIIYNGITAQEAYLQAIYKHSPEATKYLSTLVANFCEARKASLGIIAKATTILNCGTIKNVNIGDAACLEGVCMLQNGTIESSAKASTQIGFGVIARDFILASGSILSDGAQIERCFVGQGSILSKQFSAIDSLFFANCQGFHGEAVAVFAGPYTVTHHKSTLLIGGMYSFFNAGSGSNQSNHMYKLGPIHYGIVDRGSKMASDSYIPWPSRVGAFSLIMGKHKNKLDASNFPFSYLLAEGQETTIIPALNLQSIGTFRDADKWQARDLRTDVKQDAIEFRMLNPFVASQISAGIQTLKAMKENKFSASLSEHVKIKASSIDRALDLYTMALDFYIGEAFVARKQSAKTLDSTVLDDTVWADMAGYILPLQSVYNLLEKLELAELDSVDAIRTYFTKTEMQLEEKEWGFVRQLVLELYGTIQETEILARLKAAKTRLLDLLLADAEKEFAPQMQTCFALDQAVEKRELEFLQMRGKAEENSFVKKLKETLS